MFVLTLSLLLDWYVGDPDFIWRRLPQPVALFGKLIDQIDRLRYRNFFVEWTGEEVERGDLLAGGLLIAALLVSSLLGAAFVEFVTGLFGPFGWLIEVPVVAVFIAQRGLVDQLISGPDPQPNKPGIRSDFGVFGVRKQFVAPSRTDVVAQRYRAQREL